MEYTVILHTGSNLGDRATYLAAARAAIGAQIGPIQAASAIYETAAWGVEDQPAFLNQALLIHTRLSANAVLRTIQAIEQSAGRAREVRWGARTLDIDILTYDDAVLETPALVLPHPRLSERNFVLAPLCDIAPEWRHPVLQRTAAQLWADCPDTLPAERWTPTAVH